MADRKGMVYFGGVIPQEMRHKKAYILSWEKTFPRKKKNKQAKKNPPKHRKNTKNPKVT